MKKNTVRKSKSANVNKNNTKENEVMSKETSSETAQQYAEVQFAGEAKDVIMQLDVLTVNTVNSYMEMGRVVHDFANKVTENGRIGVNAYDILAKSPDARYKSDMLRKYSEVYKMVAEMQAKGYTPQVSMSHIVALLYCNADIDQKIDIAKEAQSKGLSTRAVKKIVAEKCPNKKTAKKKKKDAPVISDYVCATDKLMNSLKAAYDALSAFGMVKKDNVVSAKILCSMESFVEMAVSQGLINPSNLNFNHQGTVASELKEVA